MEDKSYTHIFYDILGKVLQLSENPSQFAEFLSEQIREIIGAKTVVIATKDETGQPVIFSFFPNRRKEWCSQPVIFQLAEYSFSFDKIELLSKEGNDKTIAQYFVTLEIEKAIAIPLIAGNRLVGSILLLDMMDLFGIKEVIDLLNRLSGVFALIIRNSVLYHNLEETVALRTKELQKRNSELIDREIQLKTANEEYATINEELTESISKVSEINKELATAKEKAEESDRLKTAFLQNMSHEIRTPMNAIIGFSGFLNKPELSEEKRNSFIKIIINSTKQLLSIVTDILTISSVETKQEKVNIQKVCINNIIVDLLAIFKAQAFNQNISLYAKQQLSDSQSEIYTDSTKVTQILTNMISNALKFTHEGYVEFGYELIETNGRSSVETCAEMDGLPSQQIQFYVKDTGIGISPDQKDKIFERFRQADLSITKKYGGTGLGLSISKGFTELLDGKIWVDSEPGKGSTFYFSIPYNSVNKVDNLYSEKNKKRKTILIAEDEEFNFLLIEEMLVNMGFTIIHAKDGKESVEYCKSNPNIDLILMDIKMPVMDGHTAALLIKKIYPSLPIIAQTAYALEHEKEKYSNNVFTDYITKPIKEEELVQKVLKYIDK